MNESAESMHTFAVCAYGESPYLDACLHSLLSQEDAGKKSRIILCTSTPNAVIRGAAERYHIPLFVREGESGLKADWNFAVRCAAEQTKAALVTIAHQDDIYHPAYLKALQEAVRRYPDMSVFCTRYDTIDGNGNVIYGKAEAVKRILRLPLRLRAISHLRLIKRLPLCFGNAIGCPTCTYRLSLTGTELFRDNDHFVIDWKTLWRLAGQKGRFICEEKPLLSYRVHAGAATMENIRSRNREREEAEMFRRIWPESVVRLLMHFYRRAYTAYEEE